MSALAEFIYMPQKCRRSAQATSPVVPLPQNGSITTHGRLPPPQVHDRRQSPVSTWPGRRLLTRTHGAPQARQHPLSLVDARTQGSTSLGGKVAKCECHDQAPQLQ